jgi:phospholipid/cholesterol/gamma-HCH transport system substrate-binding protein
MTDAARTLKNTAHASAQLDPVIKRIESSAAAVEKMGNEVAMAGKTVNSIGADVKRFTAETMPELERLLGELSVLSTSLRRLTEQTERNPSSLLFGRRPVPEGPGETSRGAQKP